MYVNSLVNSIVKHIFVILLEIQTCSEDMYMNQTQKRLSIINLAISITDIETIQLQILKLGLLKTDTRIQEIITVLQAENYAKAQRLIKTYIETPVDMVVQRASQEQSLTLEEPNPHTNDTIISQEDQNIIDEFQLFLVNDDNTPKEKKREEINIHDFLSDTTDAHTASESETQENDFDTLLHIEADEIKPDTDKNTRENTHDSFFDVPVKDKHVQADEKSLHRDTFFDTVKTENKSKNISQKDPFDTLLNLKTDTKPTVDQPSEHQSTDISFTQTKKINPESSKREDKKPLDENSTMNTEVKKAPENYPPITYIRQKFVSMKKRYEPIQKINERFPTVQTFLTTINQDGYKEKEIEESLKYVEKLTKEQKFSEAAQLLLLCASTESKFAQFMLARELYRGVLLRKKVDEAFNILTHMADDKYPEALCDLGQFYENGIGIAKNKKVAQELYKEAMELGINRAKKHYDRLNKENKSLFKR